MMEEIENVFSLPKHLDKKTHEKEVMFIALLCSNFCDILRQTYYETSDEFLKIDEGEFNANIFANIIAHTYVSTLHSDNPYQDRIDYITQSLDEIKENVINLYQANEAIKANRNVKN